MAPDLTRDCHIRPGQCAGLKVIFGKTYDFAEQVVVDNNVTLPDGRPLVKKHNFSFLMKGKTGALSVRETVNGDQYQSAVRIDRDAFNIIQYDNLDADGNASDTFTVHIILREGRSFVVESDGNMKPNLPRKKGDPDFLMMLDYNTIMYRNRNTIAGYRNFKVIVPEYRKITNEFIFQIDIAKKILNQELLSDYRFAPATYIRLQLAALKSEDTLKLQKETLLLRKNVSVRFQKLAGYNNRWYVELSQQKSDPQWMLQGQERIFFECNTGFFSEVPTATPGMRDKSHWRGTVFFRSGSPCATIDNLMPQGMIDKVGIGKVEHGITIKMDNEEDIVAVRAVKAIRHLGEAMKGQVDPNYRPGDPDIRMWYYLPPAGLLMSGRRELIKTNIPPLSVLGGTLDQALEPARYQFARQSHKTAVKNMLESPCGVSLVLGPPATGKTELVAKMICFTLMKTNLPRDQDIVAAAHTNVAIAVLCKRIIKVGTALFDLKKDQICLVWTENKAQYGRLINKDLPPELQDITLDAHLHRLACTDRARYSGYFRGKSQLDAQGRIEDNPTRKAYLADVGGLIELLKSTVRIWCCTLATFHLGSWIFGKERDWTGIDCGLLVIDEASQAHSTSTWLPWHVVNPRRIVLAGDHLQLAPFTATTEADWAWSISLFQELKEDPRADIPNVMLDLQFRTAENIYAGTNVFYQNEVMSHDSTKDRTLSKNLLQAVRRISFIDQQRKTFRLSLNTHWFDIQNGKSITKGETLSSTNLEEGTFLVALFAALQQCGIPANECLLLTGYQAMHDDLVEFSQFLPSSGTAVKKVDSAQGDEAGIVGASLVRTLPGGIGFMANARRQNVLTSRARDGFFGIGQVKALQQAQNRGQPAWGRWYQQMQTRNGPEWSISFHAPVEFHIDGKPFKKPSQSRPPPPDAPQLSANNNIIEDAIKENLIPPVAARTQSSVRVARSGSVSSNRNVSGGEVSGSPRGSQSGSPRGSIDVSRPSTPIRSPRPVSTGSPGQILPVRSGGANLDWNVGSSRRQSSGSYPRQSSTLNPDSRRSGSISQAPTYWATPSINAAIATINTRTAAELTATIKDSMKEISTYGAENVARIKQQVEGLFNARLAGKVDEYNKVLENRPNGTPEKIVENYVTLAYAMVRVYNLGGGKVEWPIK